MFRRFVMLSIWLGALGCVPGKQPELMEAAPPSSSPSPGSLVLRSAEPVWETIWAEGADNGAPEASLSTTKISSTRQTHKVKA